MKKRLFALVVFSIFSIVSYSQSKPKLVVGIIIDQMRMEYLYRFQHDMGQKGFKRMMNEGYTFHNMQFNYMPTYTAPGHASVYTGTTPKIHGIVGNEYYHRQTHKDRYCTDDDSAKLVGIGKEEEGKMSPRNLLSTTITDESKIASNFKNKVIGISIKDRGAILPAGHFANLALWWSKKGNFISSSFYGNELPQWVVQFNNEKHYDKYLTKGWNLFRPLDQYNESLPDVNKYEGKLNGRIEPKFPYDFTKEYAEHGPDVIKLTPYGNDLLMELAKAAIEQEKMGQGSTTDFLTVSFSSTDYVGHVLGPRSLELQDTYLRLDSTLGEFLSYLDKKIGKNNYTVFLTADHACNENPNEMHDHGYQVNNIDYKAFAKQLKQFSINKYGVNVVEDYSNHNLFINQDSIAAVRQSMQDVKKDFVTYLESIDYVKRVYTQEEILQSSSVDPHLERISRGYDPKQNGQIVVLYNPGFMEYGYTGTSHGSSYGYDTHVPGLFFGHGVKHGASHRKVEITSIAPTIAQMMGITFPNSTEAIVLEEIMRNK